MKDAGPTREGPWSGLSEHSDILDETMAARPGDSPDEPRVSYAPGTTISRYVILYEVGAGGMGVVYAAFDPQLNRKIALKILIPTAGQTQRRGADQAAARLMREAQAIARLSHPNVVNVYDVGRHGTAVFVAMEFIEGDTLTRWLDHEQPSLDELRRVFGLAGRGLAAAHAAGLVHRDFKPDNVLVSTDGRVRVLDFGLARADPTYGSHASPASNASYDSDDDSEDGLAPSDGIPRLRDFGDSDVLSSPLTLDDAVVGTPRYMAPEQHAGVGVDARSDQFSFCVALYQALYKQDPFPSNRLPELVLLKQEGRIAAVPPDAGIPVRLEALVMQGLAPSPADRWPSMDELLAELEHDPEWTRRRLATALGATAAVALLVGLAYRQGSEQPCQGSERHLEGLWDGPQREAVRSSIIGTGLPYAEHTWSVVEQRIDADLEVWTQTHQETCEATRVRGEQSDELLDLRMSCLEDHLAEVRAVVDVLAEADASVVPRAVPIVSGLPGLERCADAEQLRAQVPPPKDAETREQVEALRQRLRDASAREAARRVKEARAMVEDVYVQAEVLGYEPLRVEALLHVGISLENAGKFVEAEARLREAMWAALRIKHDDVATRAAIQLISVVGDRLARFDEGLTWSEQATAWLDRINEDGPMRGSLYNNIGSVLYRKGENERALQFYERSIAIREQEEGPDDPLVVRELINLGNVHLVLGDYEAALATYRRAEEGMTKALGEGHPEIAMAVMSIGIVYQETGRPAEALEQHRRGLPVFEAWLGPEHLFVATTISNIGVALRDLGRYEESLVEFRRAQVLYENSLGAEHPEVARSLFNVALVREMQGLLDEARKLHERALELRIKQFGEDHAEVIASRLSLASLRRQQGDAARAVTELEAMAAVGERDELGVRIRGGIHLELAKGRWDAGQSQSRVWADLERARGFMREAGPGGGRTLEELETWKREHEIDDRPRDEQGAILSAPAPGGATPALPGGRATPALPGGEGSDPGAASPPVPGGGEPTAREP